MPVQKPSFAVCLNGFYLFLVEIRVMVRNVQLPHRDTIKALEKKLALCCNPDNNSESPA